MGQGGGRELDRSKCPGEEGGKDGKKGDEKGREDPVKPSRRTGSSKCQGRQRTVRSLVMR